MYHPPFPGFLGQILVPPLAQAPTPWHTVQPRQILVKLHAMHHPRTGRSRLRRRCFSSARIVRHIFLLVLCTILYLTSSPPKFPARQKPCKRDVRSVKLRVLKNRIWTIRKLALL